jgi:hydroxymethylpyrimidine pyrophosphatase-like HAD family hydrolase
MKILAMDYDGTLKIDGEVSAKDLAAIERWKKAGNVFVIDTGRSLESIQMEAKT